MNATSTIQAAYLNLLHSGELQNRVKQAQQMLASCKGCAWECGVDRTRGELGQCRSGLRARVSSAFPHHGEEDPLRGWRGSGTIFFSRCNLHCIYCQNHDISQRDAGSEVNAEDLAGLMLELQEMGCHNINLVSPSHVVAQILEGLLLAAAAGLHLPIVYNTGGYDSPASLALLNGIVDIYMPDMKYADEATAKQLSGVPGYPQVNREAVREMHRQVGDLQIDEQGIALRGLLVRHLVLPGGLSGTDEIVQFLAQEISTGTYLNLMDQYRPEYRAGQVPELNRSITREEYRRAREAARQAGLNRLDQRRDIFL